jgi:hypothetical protein
LPAASSFLQFLLALRAGVGTNARITALIYSCALAFAAFCSGPLNRQPGDLHRFYFERAALQRRGGVEFSLILLAARVRFSLSRLEAMARNSFS